MTDSPRVPEAPIESLFLRRWSPRAFASAPIPPKTLASLFEAARWSPSCYNAQPWLFLHASEAAGRERVLALIGEGNRSWASAAPVVGILFARKDFEHNGQPNRWHAYDAGAAAMALSLQAEASGLATHFMGGFDAAGAAAALAVAPAPYAPHAAFAIGERGDPDQLPAELAQREGPSGRKALTEVAREVK